MEKYRHLIVGAGRIGAAYNWHDDLYSHAGASRALSDRVELVGFVDPDEKRQRFAEDKYQLPCYTELEFCLKEQEPDIVSACTQPEQQEEILTKLEGKVKAVYCEKPYIGKKHSYPIQVNYIRRADPLHRIFANEPYFGRKQRTLLVAAKQDIHTTCHFEDLARWWKAVLYYIPFNGPNAYMLFDQYEDKVIHVFRDGGVSGGDCMKAMLANLLDHLDFGTELFSPAY